MKTKPLGKAWVIENTITSEWWNDGSWTKVRVNAQAFRYETDADAELVKNNLDKILGVEPVEYLIELLTIKRKKGKK